MNLVCPIDNKDDSIQKVSAVVASGQSAGTFSGISGGAISYAGKSGNTIGYTSLSGKSTSSLAMLLAPPTEPVKPKGFGWWWTLIYPATLFIGYYLVLFIFIRFFGIGRFLQPVFHIGIVYTFYALIFFLGTWLSYRLFKSMENTKKTREEAIYLTEKSYWDSAMQRWDRAYYCHKHDIVFDPESGASSSPNSISEFLYQSKGG